MHEKSELRSVVGPVEWMVAVAALLALAAGVVLVVGHGSGRVSVGGVLCALGLLALAWVVIGRRRALIADAEGLTYRTRWREHTISWKRLSSLQVKRSGGRPAADLVVVNDMGRKQMQIPVAQFGRRPLAAWVRTLPTRWSGLEQLDD